MSVLKAVSVAKSFTGRRVVNGVSLEVKGGEIVGLLGPNGAGKTTTFHMLVGLVQPDEGQVLLNDEDLTGAPIYQRARAGISYLPQESSVFRRLTVEDNLRAILQTLDLSAAEQQERADGLMKMLGVTHLATHKAFTLSGGERRRVEIARALVLSPFFLTARRTVYRHRSDRGCGDTKNRAPAHSQRHRHSHHGSQCQGNPGYMRPGLYRERRHGA